MRTTLPLLCLVLTLSLTAPAEAQLRETAQRNSSIQTQLYDAGAAATNALQSLFDAESFRMSHTYSASFSSFGGRASSMGMYTNTMMWQFNSDWAARMDVSVAHPLAQGGAFGDQSAQVFVRNAEVAYKPSENFQLHVQFRQRPHGRFASPFGGAFGRRHGAFGARRGASSANELFWRN